MASHVIADARTLVAQPPNITAVQAATVPTTFLTAYECLMEAAGVRKRSRVLIHASTGDTVLSNHARQHFTQDVCPGKGE